MPSWKWKTKSELYFCNCTRTQNHLVRKRTLNHLAKKKKKNKNKQSCISFSIFYENEQRTRALKIQSKNLSNKKIVVNYVNFVFHAAVNIIIIFWISFVNLPKSRNGTECKVYTPLPASAIDKLLLYYILCSKAFHDNFFKALFPSLTANTLSPFWVTNPGCNFSEQPHFKIFSVTPFM